MEDNRKEKRDKYELWASLLEGQSVFSSENLSQSDEELQKLSFLWNQCDPPQTDSGEIWEKTLRKIKAEEEAKATASAKKKSALMLICGLAAASVALLFGFVRFLDRADRVEDQKTRMEQFMLANADKEEVKEVTLVVSDKKKIEIVNNAQVAYTPTGQVNVNASKLEEAVASEGTASDGDAKDAYNQMIVPKGRRSMIVLADNSKIWVNSGSKVIYPRTFGEGKREIFVEGEVYLKVARDEARPFVVNTSAFEVEVLGTSFNVSAPKGGARADVVLVDGAVDVKDRQERHIRMKPDERVELDELGISKIETVNARDYIHWIDGVWMLDGKPLKEVVRYLTEYYGQSVCCTSAVADKPFYGKLFLNEELDEVLEAIRQTLPMEPSARKNAVYVE
ncbi:FecR domain-containing protein [Bacteroides sp. KH569_7]|uniref:FecR domain-containing protein n=1 Tax=Bacteroides muris (ex Fokt et al. 2023) TaxID=2937417 RepID=A0A9X2NXU7_9BACE|nr:FecR domain-containing protein [Bacteroides muris (ex Fokt et al. 2023)]MCR6508341.1 FecR domain-containing protein [Bacteroides muris (ex Fokt et al. 2023)]